MHFRYSNCSKKIFFEVDVIKNLSLTNWRLKVKWFLPYLVSDSQDNEQCQHLKKADRSVLHLLLLLTNSVGEKSSHESSLTATVCIREKISQHVGINAFKHRSREYLQAKIIICTAKLRHLNRHQLQSKWLGCKFLMLPSPQAISLV